MGAGGRAVCPRPVATAYRDRAAVGELHRARGVRGQVIGFWGPGGAATGGVGSGSGGAGGLPVVGSRAAVAGGALGFHLNPSARSRG